MHQCDDGAQRDIYDWSPITLETHDYTANSGYCVVQIIENNAN